AEPDQSISYTLLPGYRVERPRELAMDDERFAHISYDPKFKKISRQQRKVVIDARFKRMFEDKSFKTIYTVDKRGKKSTETSTENLRKFYELDDDDGDSDDDHEEHQSIEGSGKDGIRKDKRKMDNSSTSREVESSETSEDDDSEKSSGEYSEDEVSDEDASDTSSSSSSSEDEDSSTDGKPGEEIVHPWGEIENVVHAEDVTSRFAVCNLNWELITADDLFALFYSFKPRTGIIKSVKIYPSEFGLERMAAEECQGPGKFIDTDENVQEEISEGSEYAKEKIRQYELSKLKYFYAVVECDSPGTANAIYEECDGFEYELGASRIDLRFIPDDMKFDLEPHSVALELPTISDSKSQTYRVNALQSTNIQLTWDGVDKQRSNLMKKKFTEAEINDMDIKAYIASSSDEDAKEESDNDGKANLKNKYQALVQSAKSDGEDDEEEMEITWETGLTDMAEEIASKTKEKLMNKGLTPWEKYLQKRKEKKKEKRLAHKTTRNEDISDVPADIDINDPFFADELKNRRKTSNERNEKKSKRQLTKEELNRSAEEKSKLELLVLDSDNSRSHFNMNSLEINNPKKKKRKLDTNDSKDAPEDNFAIDVNDTRFNALYNSHEFAIDPSDSLYRKTKGMETLLKERQRRRRNGDENADSSSNSAKNNSQMKDKSISALVKSVKAKSLHLHGKKSSRLHGRKKDGNNAT
ncbi:ESF1-like protein, partial [Trichoplax sp. H2]